MLLVRGPEGSPLGWIPVIPGVLSPQAIANLLYGLQALKAHQMPHPKLAPVAFVGL